MIYFWFFNGERITLGFRPRGEHDFTWTGPHDLEGNFRPVMGVHHDC